MARTRRTRTIAAVAAAFVLVALVSVGVVRASDAPSLPPISADRLLASTAVALAGPVTVAGDVQTHLDLGLPEVPAGLGGEGGAVAMVGGSQRFRVWHSADGLRIAHVTQVSERDLVVNEREAWWWDADAMRATRVRFEDLRNLVATLPGAPPFGPPASNGHAEEAMALAGGAAAMASDPITVARRAIEALAPFASVAVEGSDDVAGRPVYALVLTPSSDRTLVGSIELSIDAETRLPLRLQVFARGAEDAAVSAGFTSVSYAPIDPSVFAFSPPAGADVVDPIEDHHPVGRSGLMPGGSAAEAKPQTRVFGEGFETRVAIELDGAVPPQLAPLLPYAGPLVSVVEVDHGSRHWLVLGAMPLDVLQADADALP